MVEYSHYVWEFNVKNSTTGNPETVGVKAVVIDDSLLSTGIPTTGDGTAKLVDEADVITYISNKIKTDISNILTTEDYTIPSVKAVQDFIKSQSHITIKKVDTLPTAGESNVIYLVPKASSKTGGNKFDEYIWQDSSWELIGDTQISLDDYVKFTDFAKTDKGGVIKSSTADGEISVDSTTGIASLNGYNDLAKKDDLEDYYAYQDGEAATTHHLISTADQIKLNGIATGATKTTIASTEVETGTKITLTNQTSSSSEAESIEFTIPNGAEPAYNKVIVNDSEASASNGQTIKFISSDSIRAETDTDSAGNPTIKFEVAAEKREIFAGEGIKLEEGPDPSGETQEVGLIISVDSEYKPNEPTYNDGCITF